jgi:predicted PurR-regulated permease PerM
MVNPDKVRNRLLTVIAILLLIGGLRAGYVVTMPVAAAAVIIAAIWPIKPWLDRALPSKLSYLGTILILLLISVGFIGAVYFSAARIVRVFVDKQGEFNRLYDSLTAWAAARGLEGFSGREGYGRLIDIGQTLLGNAYTVFVYLGFVAILVILGLPAVPALRERLHWALDAADRRELIDTVDEIASKIRHYIGMTTLMSIITGVVSALWAVTIGLELPLVWGILNFLLNFIPFIGNVVGIVPASLYAIVQFHSLTMSLVVFAGFAILQIVISNFVYPAVQGRSLSLPPVVIVVALAFWSWLWGAAGALIAVPLTVAIVIACERFRSTEWIARLLTGPPA